MGIQSNVKTSGDVIDQLNSFLQGEMSAVETYRKALDVAKDGRIVNELQNCLASHEQRVSTLTSRISELGGKPAETSGMWGTFAKAVEASAGVFGEKAAVAALEEGEDHGLADYKRDFDNLDARTRLFIEQNVFVEQKKTHRQMSLLKKALS